MRKLPRWVRLISQSLSGLSDHYMDVNPSLESVECVIKLPFEVDDWYYLGLQQVQSRTPLGKRLLKQDIAQITRAISPRPAAGPRIMHTRDTVQVVPPCSTPAQL